MKAFPAGLEAGFERKATVFSGRKKHEAAMQAHGWARRVEVFSMTGFLFFRVGKGSRDSGPG